jgi:hypothetical protein
MDYSQSHVVTFVEYLNLLKKNNCKGNQWRKAKGKEREDKWLKIVANIRTTSNQTTQKVVEKHIKTQFVAM